MFTGAEDWIANLIPERPRREGDVPQIIVTADNSSTGGGQAVMFTERVSVRDFESDHFQAQLVERIGWAVGDAHAAEQRQSDAAADQAEPPATPQAEATPVRTLDEKRLGRERATAAAPAS
jgi:hypothetical protein